MSKRSNFEKIEKDKISHDELVRSLNYDPITGIWTWLSKVSRKTVVGERAGHLCKTNGYWYIKIFGDRYASAPLAWFYMTGKWPPVIVDHENRVRNDDRWTNLRLATRSQNAANTRLNPKNTSGIRGVYFCRERQRFCAQIRVGDKHVHLGRFKSKEEARAARLAFERQHFGEFARQS